MASLSMPSISTNLAYSISSSNSPFKLRPPHRTRNTVSKVSCNTKSRDENSSEDDDYKNVESASSWRFRKRNIIIGMAGLSSANTLTSEAPVAPDFANCIHAKKPDHAAIDCCPPPMGGDLTDYVPSATKVITRPAAHGVHETYLRNYEKAIDMMKRLPPTDPRNFTQQANVHCAYCDGHYRPMGYPHSSFQVHNSWLFFPFHRLYLHFFEKICQNMLDDDTFALPFWNWDDPDGMTMPMIFTCDRSSPLYDSLRDQAHLSPRIVDLNFCHTDYSKSPGTQTRTEINYNLATMYKQMVIQSSTKRRFFGEPFDPSKPCDAAPGAIECIPHNTLHLWTGDANLHHREDMGSFYSAARDPIFYAHHANVDRMWVIYNSVLKRQNLQNPDWLNSSFVFYNEEAKPVSVKIGDCLDTRKLGYVYEDVRILWLDDRTTPRRTSIPLPSALNSSEVFPATLDKIITVKVSRPKESMTRKEKEAAEEVLVIEGIEYNPGEFVKFDVYVNEDNPSESGPDKTEFLGSFVNVPHGRQMTTKTSQKFALTAVLKELRADDFDEILVTLAPMRGVATIKGIDIKFDCSNFED